MIKVKAKCHAHAERLLVIYLEAKTLENIERERYAKDNDSFPYKKMSLAHMDACNLATIAARNLADCFQLE